MRNMAKTMVLASTLETAQLQKQAAAAAPLGTPYKPKVSNCDTAAQMGTISKVSVHAKVTQQTLRTFYKTPRQPW